MSAVTGKDARDILSLSSSSSSSSSSSAHASQPAPASASRPPRPPQGPPTHDPRSSAHRSRHRGSGIGVGSSSSSSSSAKRKSDGITRELYALLGDNAPSLAVAQHQARAMMLAGHEGSGGGGEGGHDDSAQDGGEGALRPKFKKRKRRESKVARWEWAPFEHPARKDGLVLRHWARRGGRDDGADAPHDSSESPYAFAAFDTTSGVYTYTSDEYSAHLRDDDWSKEETDYLIDLCVAYDLRFVVIADRWDWPATAHTKQPRTMEDLKARYYAIARRLIRSRISADDVDARQALLQTYAFDKARESERKRMLVRLFTRTPAQLAEEEALYVEARRLEQQEARFANDREDLLKLLGGWERVPNVAPSLVAEAGAGLALTGGSASGTMTPDDAAAAAADAAPTASNKRKKQRRGGGGGGGDEGGGPESTPAASSSTAAAAPPPLTAKQKAELKAAHFDALQHITRFDVDTPLPARPPYAFLIGVPSTYPPLPPASASASHAHASSAAAASNASHGVYLRSARVLAPRAAQLHRAMQVLAEMRPRVGARLVFPTRANCEKWEGLLGAVTSGLEVKKQTDRVESELRIAKSRLASLLGSSSSSSTGATSTSTSTSTWTWTLPATAPARGRAAAAARRSATPRTATVTAARSSRSRTPRACLAAGAGSAENPLEVGTASSAGTNAGTGVSTPGAGVAAGGESRAGVRQGVEGEGERERGTEVEMKDAA